MNPTMWIVPLLAAASDTGAAPRAPGRACGADSSYTRVPVYVQVTVATRADTVAASSLLLIAESVATHIRAALGAAPDSMPVGEPVLAADSVWRGDTTASRARTRLDSAGLRVVVRRGGSLQWAPIQTPPAPPTALLDRGLTAAKEAGDVIVPAEVFAADSIVFTLGYLYRYDIISGRVRPAAYGPGTLAAFTLRTAVEKQAASVPGTLDVRYPESALHGRAEAFVRMRFVVDTTGRAIPSTVQDVWPKDRPRATGEVGDYYRQFVKYATEAVTRARFYPAEIAGCKVKQLVELPMTWNIRR